MGYKVIYCARIQDEKHNGMIKIGDTDFTPRKDIRMYSANDDELKTAAEMRIREWSRTAAAGAELIYCDLLLRYNETSCNYETFRDHEVHTLVQSVGGYRVDFDSNLDSGKEWFKTNLGTVIAAIKATKEGRDYLETSEIPEQPIYNLREEQKEAVDKTYNRFKKAKDMLWHAKMRFGKTIAALNLVKKEKFKRTIIITHRPVVEDGWGSDFYHVFSNCDSYSFLTKIHDNNASFDDDTTNEEIDTANERRLKRLVDEEKNIVYFASIQDLRGSKAVGGKFDKNRIVFEIPWDLIIVDEAHEGTKTELGQAVINLLTKKNTKKLDLSGTAYNLLDKYTDDESVYTWDYVMEQERKRTWNETHPNEPNPYEDMPQMHINTFDLQKALEKYKMDLSGKTFSFKEFFRTWTGDINKDGVRIPGNAEVGEFVHKNDVIHFLDILSLEETKNKFPYASRKACDCNIHTLWMVPGVKEAAALSQTLKTHPFFKNFGIANVAGEGDHDEEKNYSNALDFVRRTIEKNPFTITLSCGRLTTGVTVKEWSSVFMLSGSDETDAKQYMQTIFRVQSAGIINGVKKQDCYVYDFAPDRALTVIAETAGSRKSKREGTIVGINSEYDAIKSFLNYCPVVAIDGAEFKPFDVQSLVKQINRIHIGRALRTGFMDSCIYDLSKFKSITKDDVKKLNGIFSKLKETKQKAPLKKAGMAKNGTAKESSMASKTSQKEQERHEHEQKKLEKDIIERLRTISIRIPLLFYGGNFEIEEGRLGEILSGIDDDSWNVFMPTHLTKSDFKELVKYYNQETVVGAGKIIREKANAANLLPPTERTIAIAEIFSHFQNPSHETVLTPWRVVNLHMSTTLGGYCFFNENFDENTDEYYYRLNTPRYTFEDEITKKTLENANASILEINSKTGLYPLYLVYSLYRNRLKQIEKEESECTHKELCTIWNEAVSQVYVVCQSKMSAQITQKTICGYENAYPHIRYEHNLVSELKKDVKKFSKKIIKASYWKEGASGVMKFEAVVGNPPYQEEVENWESKTNGQARRNNIFHYFQLAADEISDEYVSLIYPGGRWIHRSGKRMKQFGMYQINDIKLSKIDYFPDAKDIFKNVDIADGISIVFKDKRKSAPGFKYTYRENNRPPIVEFRDNPGESLISLNPQNDTIIKKIEKYVSEHSIGYLNRRVLSQKLFGIESSFVEDNPNLVREYVENNIDYGHEIKLYTNDKAGKSGRSKWYIVERNIISSGLEHLGKWHVIVSSANAGGQKRDNQIRIVDNNTAFGRSRVAIGEFESEEEARNYYDYCRTYLVKFMFLMTDEALTSLGKKVPDFDTYENGNGILDFSQNLNDQLYREFELSDEEIRYIEKTVDEKTSRK